MKTRKLFSISCLLVFLFWGCSSNSAENQEEQAIQQVFNDYKKSIIEKDGALFYNLIETSTKDYYDNILRIIKNYDRSALEEHLSGTAYPFVDRAIIFSARSHIPAELINNSDLKGFIGGTVKHNTMDREFVDRLSFRNVDYIVENGAVASFRVRLEEKLFMRCRVNFVKIGEEWKMDVSSRYYNTNKIFKKLHQQSNLSEDDFVIQLLEEQNGVSIDRSKIWEATIKEEEGRESS